MPQIADTNPHGPMTRVSTNVHAHALKKDRVTPTRGAETAAGEVDEGGQVPHLTNPCTELGLELRLQGLNLYPLPGTKSS